MTTSSSATANPSRLLGVKAVLTTSFGRIHRSNLIGMGVLPLQFSPGESADSLWLNGEEVYAITGLAGAGEVPKKVRVRVEQNGKSGDISAEVRIDTPAEAAYFQNGGILQFVLRKLLAV